MLRNDAIAQVAVVGVPDERLGGRDGLRGAPQRHDRDRAEYAAWAKDEMANFKAPRHVEIVDEIPLNTIGKVLKYELRDRGARLSLADARFARSRRPSLDHGLAPCSATRSAASACCSRTPMSAAPPSRRRSVPAPVEPVHSSDLVRDPHPHRTPGVVQPTEQHHLVPASGRIAASMMVIAHVGNTIPSAALVHAELERHRPPRFGSRTPSKDHATHDHVAGDHRDGGIGAVPHREEGVRDSDERTPAARSGRST